MESVKKDCSESVQACHLCANKDWGAVIRDLTQRLETAESNSDHYLLLFDAEKQRAEAAECHLTKLEAVVVKANEAVQSAIYDSLREGR